MRMVAQRALLSAKVPKRPRMEDLARGKEKHVLFQPDDQKENISNKEAERNTEI